jgi:hypothetical protein
MSEIIDYFSIDYSKFKELIRLSKLNNKFNFKIFLFNLKRSLRDPFNEKQSFSQKNIHEFLLSVFDYYWNVKSEIYNDRISSSELVDLIYDKYSSIVNISLREISSKNKNYPDTNKLFFIFFSKKDLREIVSNFDPFLSKSKFYYLIEEKMLNLLHEIFYKTIENDGWLSKEELENLIRSYKKEFYRIKKDYRNYYVKYLGKLSKDKKNQDHLVLYKDIIARSLFKIK